MIKTEQKKFFELFSQCLANAGIEYASTKDGEAYVAYNDEGTLFTITYYKSQGKYVFGNTALLKSKYAKYEIPDDAVPNPKTVFETVAFAYKLRKTIIKARKDVFAIYNDILNGSDITMQMRGDFETYMIMNSGIPGYAIGYNPKTHQYGFKRYELANTLYKICEISLDKKPSYSRLYEHTKNYYLIQIAAENIEHLYDF